MRIFLLATVTVSTNIAFAARPADVYILSGQSNMQGVGLISELSPADKEPCPNAFYWNGTAFVPLVPGTTKTSAKAAEFGPEITFAKAICSKHPDRDIYLIKYYASGQPLHHGWSNNKFHDGPPAPNRVNFYPGEKPGDPNVGTLYKTQNNLTQKALESLRAKGVDFSIRGFLWMQGEMDAKNPASATEYATSLKRLKKRVEEDVKSSPIPMVFGQVLPHEPALPRFTNRTEIRQTMKNADQGSGHKDAIPGVKMVSTDGFPLNPDTVHYTAAGQAKLGYAFATAIETLQATPKK